MTVIEQRHAAMLRHTRHVIEDDATIVSFNSLQGFLFALRAHCGRDARGPSSCVESSDADRVEKQRKGRQGLGTILGTKAEKNDAAFAHSHFNQRSFPLNAIAT